MKDEELRGIVGINFPEAYQSQRDKRTDVDLLGLDWLSQGWELYVRPIPTVTTGRRVRVIAHPNARNQDLCLKTRIDRDLAQNLFLQIGQEVIVVDKERGVVRPAYPVSQDIPPYFDLVTVDPTEWVCLEGLIKRAPEFLDQFRDRQEAAAWITLVEKALPGAEMICRIMDLVCPVAKGQRGQVLAPPKAGKTTIIKALALALSQLKDAILLICLAGERPEEVTRMIRLLQFFPGIEIYSSTFDEPARLQSAVADFCLMRGLELMRAGKNAIILFESISRLGRAQNGLAALLPIEDRGGMDKGGLFQPGIERLKQWIGAARATEDAGNLTIIGTGLIRTKRELDEAIANEVTGTGNMNAELSGKMAQEGIYPSFMIPRSSTREDRLFLPVEYAEARDRFIAPYNTEGRTTGHLIRRIMETDSNAELLRRGVPLTEATDPGFAKLMGASVNLDEETTLDDVISGLGMKHQPRKSRRRRS